MKQSTLVRIALGGCAAVALAVTFYVRTDSANGPVPGRNVPDMDCRSSRVPAIGASELERPPRVAEARTAAIPNEVPAVPDPIADRQPAANSVADLLSFPETNPVESEATRRSLEHLLEDLNGSLRSPSETTLPDREATQRALEQLLEDRSGSLRELIKQAQEPGLPHSSR
jgi:hypothetical protein